MREKYNIEQVESDDEKKDYNTWEPKTIIEKLAFAIP